MSFSQQPKITWMPYITPPRDGSEGGRVATNVIIRKTARVLPGASVPDDTIIELGVIFTPDGPIKFTKKTRFEGLF